jgi:hypothetical protein
LKPTTIFLTCIFLLVFSGNGQVKRTKSIVATQAEKKSIETIKRIFKNYTHFDESIDSREKKDSMQIALSSLPSNLNMNDLLLLVNVWMYYDATDFPTRDILMPVFIKNKNESLLAIEYRIKHKKKWESNDGVPYSELKELERDLKLNHIK